MDQNQTAVQASQSHGETQREVIVIGAGPAGYTAAIYLARAELKPLVLAGEKSGGQLMLTTEVENYPGFKAGVMGPDLMMEMKEQAKKFGAEIKDVNVTKVDFSQKPFGVWVGEEEYRAKTVIIASGAKSRLLGVPGEEKLMGRGVSTCAVCDAPFYKDKAQTYVVGGGDAAMEEVLALSKYAKKVGVIHRRDVLRASKVMQKRVQEKQNVEFLFNSEVVEIKGSEKAEAIVVKNNKSGEQQELPMDGVFIAIGHIPATEIFKGQVRLNPKGYVLTRLGFEKQSLEMAMANMDDKGLVKFSTQTSVEGVFAAGDVVDFVYRQAVTAAGFGTMAALDAERLLTGSVGGSWMTMSQY